MPMYANRQTALMALCSLSHEIQRTCTHSMDEECTWWRVAGRRCPEVGCLGVLIMLETVAVILIILWLLGLVTSYTMGGFIHLLLVIAIVVILLRVIQGRRVV